MNEDIAKTVGFKIKVLRLRKNIKQKELAKKLGFSASHLATLENGNKLISLEKLIKTAKILNVDLNYFDPRTENISLSQI